MKILRFSHEEFLYPLFGTVEGDRVTPLKNIYHVSDLFQAIQKGELEIGDELPLSHINLLPPTDERINVYCAGLNYADHAREMDLPIPLEPVFFVKVWNTLASGNDNIIFPPETRLMDYEIELALVVGRRITSEDFITQKNMKDYLLGITILNDITARDIQLRSGQWFSAKNFRTFAPMGPLVQVMDDDVCERLYDCHLKLQVFSENGDILENRSQRGNTREMIFPIERLISFLSARFDLMPGDVISTGTPAGVAMSRFEGRGRFPFFRKNDSLSERERFIEQEIESNERYPEVGNIITARIFSEDGIIDLGEQKNRIVSPI